MRLAHSPSSPLCPHPPFFSARFHLLVACGVLVLNAAPLAAHETGEAHTHTGGSNAAAAVTSKPTLPSDPGVHEESFTGDAYTLGRCAGCEMDLSVIARPTHWIYQGRDLLFCCPHCKQHFESKPKESMEEVDADIIKQQKPFYPLNTCLVSKEPLDSKGGAVDFVYMNSLVRVCSKECEAEFGKEPQKFMKELHAAVVERQKPAYPLTTCVVSGEELGSMGAPVDYVAGNRLVRLCSADCEKTFEKNPAKYLGKLDAAVKEKAGGTANGSAAATSPTPAAQGKNEKAREGSPAHH